jgi:hypothetical protein
VDLVDGGWGEVLPIMAVPPATQPG